jgi:hypothetical protein
LRKLCDDKKAVINNESVFAYCLYEPNIHA